MLRRLIATERRLAPLLLRLSLGVVFFPHGAQKALGLFGGEGFSGTVASFEKGGMPAPLAVLVIAAEFLGSLGLLVGLLTRVAALGIGTVMTVAILKVHLANGFFMNWFGKVDAATGKAAGEGFEYHLLALGIALALMAAGGGAASADLALSRRPPPPNP